MGRKPQGRSHQGCRASSATKEHPAHHFTLILGGGLQIDEGLETSLFEAGCDDALLGIRDGVLFLEFDRRAATFARAVLSAIHAVELVKGLDVVRVEPDDLVTASEIARRIGRSRESVRQLATGTRGPGGFPPPAHNLRGQSPLWRWTEVQAWVDTHIADAGLTDPDREAATFIAFLNSALQMHRLVPTSSPVRALWSTMRNWHATTRRPRYEWVRLLEERPSK